VSPAGPPDEPGDPGNPFQGVPFLGDLARLIGHQGPVSWDAARQLAMSIATGGQSEPNVDPLERMKLEQLVRVAELQVADATGLSTSITGSSVTAAPVNRSLWVARSDAAYRELFEQLASSLTGPHVIGGAAADEAGLDDAMSAWMGQLMQLLGPMMLGMTAGSLLGHLSRRSFGQYDLPVPRPPADELLIVTPNIVEFAEAWSLPIDDLQLWVCLHEVAHHAVLGVPHVRERLSGLLREYASGFEPDPGALEHRLGDMALDDPSSLADLQQALGDPEVLLGAMQSPAQRALLPRLEALVAVVVGYVDNVMDRVGERLIGSYGRVTEAMRRRRVEADPSDRFVERLLGLELTQAQYERGAAFADGVVERGGPVALERLWRSERELPTPAEVDAPGLWLARIDLPD
jgi:putative hydrolase